MTIARRIAAPTLGALALAATLGLAAAAEGDRGTGAPGRGDGSGMGQDNTEMGTSKGPGDKPATTPPDVTKEQRLEGTSPEGTGMIGRCDDGKPPVNGACSK
ncbi:hypothetical protein [Chenggangzhangella methanolivorans]|uniref:Secreted protein n=1 Tax=Chenggangzhangella methanolivorans TaxID=1437009 RepID=A0A9E6R9Y3_9HYPH|nr:hypothetical protein [Chenggangzhangella methanolivorans]QZN99352.1 hypothetical protein K6K41_21640 [Chenggangzhangella methanolivorans]